MSKLPIDCTTVDGLAGNILIRSKKIRDKVIELANWIKDAERLLETTKEAFQGPLKKSIRNQQDELDSILFGSLLDKSDRTQYKDFILSKIRDKKKLEDMFEVFEAMDDISIVPFRDMTKEQKDFLRLFGIKSNVSLKATLDKVNAGFKRKFATDVVLEDSHNLKSALKKFKVESKEELLEKIKGFSDEDIVKAFWKKDEYFNDISWSEQLYKEVNNYIIANRLFGDNMPIEDVIKQVKKIYKKWPSLLSRKLINQQRTLGWLRDLVFRNISALRDKDLAVAFHEKLNKLKSWLDNEAYEYMDALDSASQYVGNRTEFLKKSKSKSITHRAKRFGFQFTPTKSQVEESLDLSNVKDKNKAIDEEFEKIFKEGNYGFALENKLLEFVEWVTQRKTYKQKIGLTELAIEDLPKVVKLLGYTKLESKIDDVAKLITKASQFDGVMKEVIDDFLARLDNWAWVEVLEEYISVLDSYSWDPMEVAMSIISNKKVDINKAYFFDMASQVTEKFSDITNIGSELYDNVYRSNGIELWDMKTVAWVDEMISLFEEGKLTDIVLQNSIRFKALKESGVVWTLNTIAKEKGFAPPKFIYPDGDLVYSFMYKDGKLILGSQDTHARQAIIDSLDKVAEDMRIDFEYFDEGIYNEFMSLRYWEDAWKAQELIRDEFWDMLPNEVDKKLELVSKIDDRFLDRYVNLDEIYESLPNDEGFYRDFANRLANDEGYPVITATSSNTVDELKELYMRVKYHDNFDDYLEAKADLMTAFGSTYQSNGLDGTFKLYNTVIQWVERRGFIVPHLDIKPMMRSIENAWEVDDRGFISAFVWRNKGRADFDQLPWATDFEKALWLFRNLYSDAKQVVAPRVPSWRRLTWFKKVREFLDNQFNRPVDFDAAEAILKSSDKVNNKPAVLTKKYKERATGIIDSYSKEVKKLINKWVSENELNVVRKKAQLSIVRLENDMIEAFWDLFKNKKDLYTKKFDVFKINSIDDITSFDETIDRLKQWFDNTFEKIEDIAKKAKDTTDFIDEYGIVSTFKDGKYVKASVDDLLLWAAKELPEDIGFLWLLKNMEYTNLSNAEKLRLYKVARVAKKVYWHATGPAEILYTKINPWLKNFFVDYQLIETDVGFLPRLLAETNSTLWINGVQVSDRTDKFIKHEILKNISSIVKRRKLSVEDLQKSVKRGVNRAQDELDNIDEAYKVYEDLFEPYTKIVAVSKENEKLFKELTLDEELLQLWKDDELRQALNDTNIETSQGKINLGSYVFGEASDSLPRVILTDNGSQKFGRETLDGAAEARRAEREKVVIENWRDWINEVDEFAAKMEKSYFQQALPIMNRNGRTKAIADVMLETEVKGREAARALKALDSLGGSFLEFLTNFWGGVKFDFDTLKKSQEIYKAYIDLSDIEFDKLRAQPRIPKTEDYVAFKLADYFRDVRRGLSPDWVNGVSVDAAFNKKLYNVAESFANIKEWNYPKVLGVISWLDRSKIFKFIDHGFAGIDSSIQLAWDLLANWDDLAKTKDINFKRFNEVFGTEFTKGQVTNIITAIWWVRLASVAENAKVFVTRMLNFMAPWAVRFLYSYPYSLVTAPFQSYGYATRIKSLQTQLGVDLYTQDSAYRRSLGVLDGFGADFAELWADIDEIVRVLQINEWQTWEEIASRFYRFLDDPKNFLKATGISLDSGRLAEIVGQVKDNGNNIIDAIFAGPIKDGAFLQAVRDEGFFGIENLREFFDNPDVAQSIKDDVLKRIKIRSNRAFSEFTGISNSSLYAIQANGNLASLFAIPSKLMNFRGWWGMSNLRSISRYFAQWGFAAKHLLANKFSQEAIDDVMGWLKETPEFRNFVHSIWSDAYWTAKLVRLQNNGEYDEEITFTDVYNTFETLSQNFQALQSAGPLRPWVSALESIAASNGVFEDIPDGAVDDPWGVWAMLNSIGQNIAREAKFIKSSANVAQAYANHLKYGSDWLDVAAEEFDKLSSGSFRYMMADNQYRKTITAPSDDIINVPTLISGQANNTDRDYMYYSMGAQTWSKVTSGETSMGDLLKHVFRQSNIYKAVEETGILLTDNSNRGNRWGNIRALEQLILDTPEGKKFVEDWYRFTPENENDYEMVVSHYKFFAPRDSGLSNGKSGIGPWGSKFAKTIEFYKEWWDLWARNVEIKNMLDFLQEEGVLDTYENALNNIGDGSQRAAQEINILAKYMDELPENDRPVGYQKVLVSGNVVNSIFQERKSLEKVAKKEAKARTGSSTLSQNTKDLIERTVNKNIIDRELDFIQEADINGNFELLGKKYVEERPEMFVNYIKTRKGDDWEEYHTFDGFYNSTLQKIGRLREDIDNGDINAFQQNFSPIVRNFDFRNENAVETLDMINQTIRYIDGKDNWTQQEKNLAKIETLTVNPVIVEKKDEFIQMWGSEWERVFADFVENIHRWGTEMIEDIISDVNNSLAWGTTWAAKRRWVGLGNVPKASFQKFKWMLDATRWDKYSRWWGSWNWRPNIKLPSDEEMFGKSRIASNKTSFKIPKSKVPPAKSEVIEWASWKKSRTKDDIRRITKGDKKTKFKFKKPKWAKKT